MPIQDPARRNSDSTDAMGPAAAKSWAETIVTVMLTAAVVLAVSLMAVLMELA